MFRATPFPALAVAILVAAMPAMAEESDEPAVEIVRPVPRGPGQHGFTIEMPRNSNAYGSFGGIEVMRGSRLPPEALVPVDQSRPPVATAQAPAARRPLTIQVRPVRPVEIQPVAPVATVGRTPNRAIQVERSRMGAPPAAPGDGEADSLPFTLPPGARTIRIR